MTQTPWIWIVKLDTEIEKKNKTEKRSIKSLIHYFKQVSTTSQTEAETGKGRLKFTCLNGGFGIL